MDFITYLPKYQGFTVILVVLDKLSKHYHYGALESNYNAVKVAQLSMEMVVKLNGFPRSIVSDKDSIFISMF